VLPQDPAFSAKLSGMNDDRLFVKFRATFATGNSQTQPPSVDTVVIPFQRVVP
jgi:hypothetical protein